MPETCIIGAGITGLATAWQLQRQGHNCIVLESGAQVGGAMQSIRRDGYLAEEGPNSIQLASSAVEDFLFSIPGVESALIEAKPSANKRYIVRHARTHAVPMNPLQAITTPLWSLGGKLRVLKEPFIAAAPPEPDQSVADFVTRRLGRELYDYAINPLVGGIYAGKPEDLSLRYGFPKLYALEQTHGGLIRGAFAKMKAAKRDPSPSIRKRIVSFKQGIHQLPQLIANALGSSVQTDVSIESIRQIGDTWAVRWNGQAQAFKRIILTVPAHALAKLPFETALTLPRIEYPPVSVISLGYRDSAIRHPMDGFGALVPARENMNILGALFPSAIFPDRAPAGHQLITVFVGGTRSPQLSTPDTDTLLAHIRPDLNQLLGIDDAPSFIHHKHWPLAIPQYKLGYEKVLRAIDTIEQQHSGLHLAGNYRTGISLTYCLENAISSPERLFGEPADYMKFRSDSD